ncbi:MAG: glycosyltransferase family 4 protein [Candidatus ainarchaeum sp.]|nr:glycosyltransferase family 4 protein [Candidatus ainarchaeum sp.]MDD3976358.1 glycosyltransferase family 4 protein [Candidatus ainarchaeum sp.]
MKCNQKILIVCPQIGKLLEGKPAGGAEKKAQSIFKDYKNCSFLVSLKNIPVNISKRKYVFIKNTKTDFIKIISAIKNADVVVFFALSRFSPIYFYLAKLYNKKIVYFISSNSDVGLFLKESSFYYRYVPKLVFPCVDLFICQTEIQEKKLNKYNHPIYRVPNPIDVQKSNYKNENFVLWVGRNHKVKGLDILEKIIEELPEIKFKIVGITNKDIAIHKNCEILGRVAPQKMQDYFNLASIYINTSYSEGYPNTTLEALSNKTPVISYSANPDYLLEKSGGGYCANGDLNKFITLIKENYYKKEKLKKMGELGRTYIKKNNDLKIIKNKIDKIFKENNIMLIK